MKLLSFQLKNIRCFEDTGPIAISQRVNVFVGRNNSGKTTILNAILSSQAGFQMGPENLRPHINDSAFMKFDLQWPSQLIPNNIGIGAGSALVGLLYVYDGTGILPSATHQFGAGQPAFNNTRPGAVFEPFVARRKAAAFSEAINSGVSNSVTGTLQHIYSRIDEIAVSGHPRHEKFRDALNDVLGFQITTRQSGGGKEAGFYFDLNNFVPLQRMGDGVSEIVALIVELCIAENKIFVIEEPETNLHPTGVKALMRLVLEASKRNQFIVSTHSNVVVRELGSQPATKIFRVFKTGELPSSPSAIEEVGDDRQIRHELLRELGYEFSDFDLFSGWLFLEESSAETVFNQILIPEFVPCLAGKLRTFSAGGVDKLEPSIDDFKRLMVFVHLSETYRDRMFIRADGDTQGKLVLEKLKLKFPTLNETHLNIFSQEQFEHYTPPTSQPENPRV